MKSKLTLLIDGNWLLMSRLSVLNHKYADDEQLCKDLKLMMIKSINIVLRQFPVIDNIIFMADGGSWRNKLDKPSFMTDDYKGQREADPTINWDAIFNTYEDLLTKFNQAGITTSKESGIEGDDWAWYWSTKLNSEGTNVIIWSKDKDLTQLVKTDKDGCFTVCWNKDSGIITDKHDVEDMDFLFNMNFTTNDDIYQKLVDKAKIVNHVNPQAVIIDKIIRGDAGDNIFPIILKKSKSNKDKFFRVSSKDLQNDLDIHNQEQIKSYIEGLLESKSYKDKEGKSLVEKPLNDIIEHFNYNRTLVTLELESYPEEILEIMNKYQTYNCSKNTAEVEYQITAEANSISSILDII